MRNWLLPAVLMLVGLLSGAARSQAPTPIELWSVQTVALRDLREAQAAALRLQEAGFDAFTEFAMDGGLQFVRVRVGCFTARHGAEAMARYLESNVGTTAAPVESTPGAPVAGCVKMDVGFLKAVDWDEINQAGLAPAFKVVVAGIEAHVAHDGLRWRVLQDGEEVPVADPALPQGRFSQAHVGGAPIVMFEAPSGPLLLCPGTLMRSVGNVAISEQGEALLACSLEPIGAG